MTDNAMTDMPALVSVDWLAGELSATDICVVDASWYMPAENRDPHAEYQNEHIPGAVFFDIDGVSDQTSELPHMLPTEQEFASMMTHLGIGDGLRIVVYDGHGLMSAARAWWTFRAFGQSQVAVLNGGLPAWKAAGHQVVSSIEDPARQAPEKPFTARLNPVLVRSIDQVRDNLDSQREAVVDARPAGRFKGIDPEPRPGLSGGHIPGSCNVPFVELLDPTTNQMLPPEQLQAKFTDAGLDLSKPIITSCGSGITASVLALGLYTLGLTDVAVYDGSWSEWGGVGNVSIATG